jgi:hypothetical protein
VVEGWNPPRLGGESVDAAVEFLRAFRDEARKFELKKAGAGSGRWLSPPKVSPPSFLFQVLDSLDALGGGPVGVSDLVGKINERFLKATRINNTRREILANRDLFEFDAEKGRVSLQEAGEAYLKAYKASARSSG